MASEKSPANLPAAEVGVGLGVGARPAATSAARSSSSSSPFTGAEEGEVRDRARVDEMDVQWTKRLFCEVGERRCTICVRKYGWCG